MRDVLVIGGGPAGSAAAKMLAELGHHVLLIDRATGPRHALAESIPPSAKKTLAALGLRDAVDAAGFETWTGNTVWWADTGPRIEAFGAGETGYQIDRAPFDALLRTLAAGAGAEVARGLVREVDGHHAIIEVDRVTTRVSAKFILDCSGRAGVIARRGRRHAETSHHTVAMSGMWRMTGAWPETQHGHTLVASHADGWAWSVPTAPGIRYFTVMVDPRRSRLTRESPAMDVYRSELAKVAPFAPWLTQAELVDGPWGADSSLYSADRYVGPGFLLVGDAGSFIDPLSSFGVKKALASAWTAAIAVNTALKTPTMAAAAMDFFDRREHEVHAGFSRLAATFADAAASGDTAHPFWQARTSASESSGVETTIDPAQLARDPAVLAAFSDLRVRTTINLRLGPNVEIGQRSVIRGHQIVMDEHLCVPAWPQGVRYLRNIDVLRLCRLATEHQDVGELYAAVERAEHGIGLPDFLGALSSLIAYKALVHL